MYRKLRKLKPLERNIQWWQGSQALKYKLAYYPSLVVCYLRLLVLNEKTVSYLGMPLRFDNPATPLSMMYYPHEITRKILSNLEVSVKTVLDIGGNIGQFSLTYATLSQDTRFDVFEPNPEAFKMLQDNTPRSMKRRISAYNYGISKPGKHTLYVAPGKSSIASFIRNNAGSRNNQKKVEIETINNISVVTGNGSYDLIKVDVEGYEYEVLNSLRGLSTKYLFIEITGLAKEKDYDHSAMFNKIKSCFGSYDVLHVSSASVHSTYFDMLLRFK